MESVAQHLVPPYLGDGCHGWLHMQLWVDYSSGYCWTLRVYFVLSSVYHLVQIYNLPPPMIT